MTYTDTTPALARSDRSRRTTRLTALAAGIGTFASVALATPAGAISAPVPAAAPQPATAAPVAPHATPGPIPRTTDAARGTLLWAQPIGILSAAQVREQLRAVGFDTRQVRGGVTLWRVVYATIGASGAATAGASGARPTTASGLVALPSRAGAPLDTVVVEHGTLAYRGDAPSTGSNPFVMGPAVQAAAAGFAGVAPDYLGLGYGPGRHPYLHIESEVTASVDLLAAAPELLSRNGTGLSGDLYVTGFSQGAPAALALAREMQRRPAGWRVRAVAPVSGPYAIWEEQIPAMLRGEVPGFVAAYYMAYALTAYDKIFDLYDRPGQVFRAPYAARVETLFNSNVPEEQIIAALPPSVEQLLTPAGMRMLTDRQGALARALKPADATCTWRPSMPVRLYVTTGDEQVPSANTLACARDFRAKGVNVAISRVPVPEGFDSAHLGSGVESAGRALNWFRALAG